MVYFSTLIRFRLKKFYDIWLENLKIKISLDTIIQPTGLSYSHYLKE